MLEHLGVPDRCLLIIGRSGASECLDGLAGLPLLEDVDPVRFQRIGAQVEVDATLGLTGLTNDVFATCEIPGAFGGFDKEVSGNDDHVVGLPQNGGRMTF